MKIKYHPEIDGLRAISVGAVIIYHAQIKISEYYLLKGGFLGVDIFFVISGYLITSIILKELLTTGKFSFLNFYKRRIRRILPALLFVILACFPLALFYLLPSNFLDFSKSVLYSLGFSSNFFFHYTGQEYSARSGLFKPLLHTWSLSVEEQYYIFFPLFFFVAFKYYKKNLIYIIALCFVLSLFAAQWTIKNYPSANFYFLHTRMWEFLAGSILAYYKLNGLSDKNTRHEIKSIMPSIGFLLIGYSILFYDQNTNHPSISTLLPIIGVCLIIWFSHKDELITKFLSSKLLVSIGLISYSLYLWHYPIFAFVRITAFNQAKIANSILIAITIFFLSIFTYYFIERPARKKSYSFKIILIIIIAFYLVIFSLSIFVVTKQGKIDKLNTLLEQQIESPLFREKCKYSSIDLNLESDNFFRQEFSSCKKKFGKFILIIGDSHSIDLFNSISKISNKNEFIISFNAKGCRPSDSYSVNCDKHYKNFLSFIKKNKNEIKYVFFTIKGSYYLTNIGNQNQRGNSKYRKLPLNQNEIENTVEYLKLIKKITEKIIFIGPHLEPNLEPTRKLLKDLILLKQPLKDSTNYDLLIVDKKLKEISKNNNIEYISKIEAINFEFKKDFMVNTMLTFSDTDHWSEFGERYFGKKLVFNSKLKEILYP
jgi:peptidoglycan/LPS O-acetylase OafA/YrhL